MEEKEQEGRRSKLGTVAEMHHAQVQEVSAGLERGECGIRLTGFNSMISLHSRTPFPSFFSVS